jgi:hypothetical protein
MENYAELFYMTGNEDAPPIQCKLSLRGPKCIRKVDGVNLIIIDFYIIGLTPRLNSTETTPQLSENITLFAICRIYTSVISKET